MTDPNPGPRPEEVNRILEKLPKDVAALLISVGALGFVMPGMAGLPAMIVGGLVLWPKTFGPVEGWLGRKFPGAHRQSLEQVQRYLKDLERRYPGALSASAAQADGSNPGGGER